MPTVQIDEDEILNKEWEKILQEQGFGNPNMSLHQMKELNQVEKDFERKKFMRQLIKGGIRNEKKLLQARMKKEDQMGVSKMVEWLTLFDISLNKKEQEEGVRREIPPSLLISLLLLGEKDMHLNVISDYELKKCKTIFTQIT